MLCVVLCGLCVSCLLLSDVCSALCVARRVSCGVVCCVLRVAFIVL